MCPLLGSTDPSGNDADGLAVKPERFTQENPDLYEMLQVKLLNILLY